MADIIDFIAHRDPENMNREELLAYLETLRGQIAALDESEPADMESEAYEDWADRNEELEDLADEAMELLEAME